jgi:uncharacterized lipoprotein NlpE involved in copper resistance
MRKNAISTLISVSILSISAVLSAPVYSQDSTRTSVDWNGYYTGTVPCGSCSGIDTWLYLNEFDGKTKYNLVETYQQDKPETFRASGNAKWQKDGSTLALKGKDENRVLFVSEGYVEFLGEGSKPSGGKSDYTLWKQDAYAGQGQQLLVNPRKVKTEGQGQAQRVSFTGLMNFEHVTEGGHKSLRARYVIDCGKKTYEMPEIAYFAKDFATGKKIHSVKKNDNPPQPFSGKEDVMAQAAEAYCSR